MDLATQKSAQGNIRVNNSGLEAAFQVPMPGDSGSSPDAGSISNGGFLSFNKSETVLWTIAKILLLFSILRDPKLTFFEVLYINFLSFYINFSVWFKQTQRKT